MLTKDHLVLSRRNILRAGAAGLAVLAGSHSSVVQAHELLVGERLHSPWERQAFRTTVSYVINFYPLWFTYYQSRLGGENVLAGPVRVSPLYQAVVAINVDTIYTSAIVYVKAQPVILTVPPTTANYSVLTLDPYGNIFETKIKAPGTYGLTSPGYRGPLPAGAVRIEMPLDVSNLIFRADKYSETGEDLTAQARAFRASLRLLPLKEYVVNPAGGATRIVPEAFYSVPFKTAADKLITRAPIVFLRQLQAAVQSSNTPPFSPQEQALSDDFDRLFADWQADQRAFQSGARRAHQRIIDNYLSQRGPTNWITFTNIGDWGDDVLDRASITEFIQFGNGRSTAAYYHAFRDGVGSPLDGRNRRGYVLTFRKDQIPEAQRFWSLTAYTPDSIELIRNPARKYAVASYTPGLQFNPDRSLSVYMATEPPPGVPMANWLPVAPQPFNIMLRVYGPEGSVADNTYIPPAIRRR